MIQNRPARIVFVEDNAGHIELAKKALRAEGFINEVDFFSTAEEALEFLETHKETPPDVIFIDRMLAYSTMQGDDLANIMMKDSTYTDTDICIMSASYVGREKENEYAASKIKFFLKKPLITDQLEAVIRASKRLRKLIIVAEENSTREAA